MNPIRHNSCLQSDLFHTCIQKIFSICGQKSYINMLKKKPSDDVNVGVISRIACVRDSLLVLEKLEVASVIFNPFLVAKLFLYG